MVLFLIVGAAAFAGERAYKHHKKSKAKKLALTQPHNINESVLVTTRSAEVVKENIYEDLPPYKKDAEGPVIQQVPVLQQGQVEIEVEVEPPMYSASQETIPIPERSPLREKAAM